jgi:NTP pyrophosphatase (non-canonical NTP hydrolase)
MNASNFQKEALRTVRINWAHEKGPDIAILGAIGELGSLASVLKKKQRDDEAYSHFKEHFSEEIGDILWYVIVMASRMNVTFDKWPSSEGLELDIFQSTYSLFDHIYLLHKKRDFLLELSSANDEIINLYLNTLRNLQHLAGFVDQNLSVIADKCINKTLSYWGSNVELPAAQFDKNFPVYEQLPREFEIEFLPIQEPHTSIMRMNGIQLGDRLTDNSYEDDGYRFHDVFHIAGVGLLGWSPVFRRLLKAKRKSDPKVDEVEDGARAAIIEEAIINHIYDFARPGFLKGISRVDLDLIKRVQRLVRGYEVSQCEPWEWQHCILESYRIFRELKESGSGVLHVNADKRRLTLLPHQGR